MESEDMYVLSYNRSIASAPSPKPYPHKPPKSSDWGPLFMKVKSIYSFTLYYSLQFLKNAEFGIDTLLIFGFLIAT